MEQREHVWNKEAKGTDFYRDILPCVKEVVNLAIEEGVTPDYTELQMSGRLEPDDIFLLHRNILVKLYNGYCIEDNRLHTQVSVYGKKKVPAT